jgi:hypothetical protein
MKVISWDIETEPIGPSAVLPRPICVQLAFRSATGKIEAHLIGNGDPEFWDVICQLFEDPEVLVLAHGGSFDSGCVMVHAPAEYKDRLTKAIFDKYEALQVTDTMDREKLLNLSTSGKLKEVWSDDEGQMISVGYTLGELEHSYSRGRIDRRGDKDDPNGVRVRFAEMDGRKAEDYDPEFTEYALADPVGTLLVYEGQARSHGQTTTEFFQATSGLPFRLESARGFRVDQREVARIEAVLREKLAPERLSLLVEHGLLIPAQPARPQVTRRKDGTETIVRAHIEGCPRKKDKEGNWLCDCPPKMVKAQPAKRAMKPLHERVLMVCGQERIPVQYTVNKATGQRTDTPKTDKKTLAPLALRDAVLGQYVHRQSLAKIAEVEIPALKGVPVVHGNFDTLKATGRASCWGSKKGVELGRPGNLYPARNLQQIPNEVAGIDLRLCYIPRPYRVFFDNDFKSLELVCLAQVTYLLFGHKPGVRLRLRELLNEGEDVHSFFGAQLAYRFGAGSKEHAEAAEAFRIAVGQRSSDLMHVYRTFEQAKAGDESMQAFYVHFRTLAKPVDLGAPGGVGPARVAFDIAPQYGLKVSLEGAREAITLLKEVFPEIQWLFDWMRDQKNQDDRTLYDYASPLGMLRARCNWTAACNGKALQTPGAEGFKIANFNVTRACLDPSVGSVLYGARPILPFHDQIVGETSEDRAGTLTEGSKLWTAQAEEASRIMVSSMRQITPDVEVEADPMLTVCPSKKAKARRHENGNLIPWTPEGWEWPNEEFVEPQNVVF